MIALAGEDRLCGATYTKLTPRDAKCQAVIVSIAGGF